MKALFVSDIHISSPEDPKYTEFLRFLEVCAHARVDHLFLVGDIFDLWISDRRYFVEKYAAAIERIRRLIELGIKVHYFEGNHDLDLRRFWQHQVGADVYSEAAFFKLDGVSLRVEHGDQMDPEDQGYLFLRWLLRTPLLVFFERYLPNFLVAWIGRRASRSSRVYTSTVKTASEGQVRDKIRTHARRVYEEHPFDILISGHVHVVEDSREGKFRVINLGTWLKEPNVLVFENGSAAFRNVSEFTAG